MSQRRSLYRELLVPMMAVCVAFVAIAVALAATYVWGHERQRLAERASSLATAVRTVGEHVDGGADLQRVVSALAADPGVELVVVAAGSPARVIASSKHLWLGKRLDELTDARAAERLGAALRQGRGDSDWGSPGVFEQTACGRFTLDEVVHLAPEPGAVLVHVDAREARSHLATTIALLVLGTLASTALLLRTLYALVYRHVLAPLDEVEGAVRAGTPVAARPGWSAQIEVLADALGQAFRERDAREAELREGEARLREVLETMPQQVWTARADGTLDHVSHRTAAYFGVDVAHLLDHGWHGVVHPDDLPLVLERWGRALATSVSYEVEFRLRAADGSYRWHIGRAHPVRGAGGDVTRWFGTNTDIAEQRQLQGELAQSLHEKDTLLREVHHRVKNNLQIVSSLLSMQGEGVEEPTAHAALVDAVHRVRSMAFVHQQLYGTDHLARVDLGEYTTTLGRFLVGSIDPSSRLDLIVEPVEATVDVAVPVGLVLNELVTNAIKHGRQPGGHAEVRVELRVVGEGFVLVVADRGPGLPESLDRPRSLGMQIVRTLTRQIRGRFELVTEGGAVARLHVASTKEIAVRSDRASAAA